MVDEHEESWAPEGFDFRDVTHELQALDEVAERNGQFRDDLVALGFEELGVMATRTHDHEDGYPVLDEDELAALREEAATGDALAVERLLFVEEGITSREMFSGRHLTWLFVHPGTHDLAELEANGMGEWLSLHRLHADGSLVRTIRRPEGDPVGTPGVSAQFQQARWPGLHALVVRLTGDTFTNHRTVKPRVRQWDQGVPSVSVREVWDAHLAFADGLELASEPVTPTRNLAVCMSRRTMDVTLASIEHVQMWGARVWIGLETLGRLAAAGILGGVTGTWLAAAVGFFLVKPVSDVVWAHGTGFSEPHEILLPLVLLMLAAGVMAVPLWALAAAFGVCSLFLVAGRLASLWCEHTRRPWFDARLAEPVPVPASRLERVYRP